MSERDDVLDRVAQMWRHRDPVPSGLVDTVLVALATETLDEEYELLHLDQRSRELAGARGGDALTIGFSGGPFSLLLRVSAISDAVCRVDGWVSPPQAMQVKVTQQSRSWRALVDALGRFEIDRLPTGLTRFFLVSDDAAADEADRSFATPTFEL